MTLQERAAGIAAIANADGEFKIAARMWNAVIVFASGDDNTRMSVRDGRIEKIAAGDSRDAADLRITGTPDGWAKMLAPVPPPFYQDLFGAALHHGFVLDAKVEEFYPYYPAVRRLIELLRESGSAGGGA